MHTAPATPVNGIIAGWIEGLQSNRAVFIDARLTESFYTAAAAAGLTGLNGGIYYPETQALCIYLS